MKKFWLITITAFLMLPLFVFGADNSLSGNVFDQQTQVFIRYEKVDWQTYEFYVDFNQDVEKIVRYRWSIDKVDYYDSSKIRYYFEPGAHVVDLTVYDALGNRKYDSLILNVNFWSIYNRTLLIFIVSFIVLMTLYYWTVKLIYLFNRRKMKKQAREFLEILDTHGWVEKVVEHIVEKK